MQHKKMETRDNDREMENKNTSSHVVRKQKQERMMER